MDLMRRLFFFFAVAGVLSSHSNQSFAADGLFSSSKSESDSESSGVSSVLSMFSSKKNPGYDDKSQAHPPAKNPGGSNFYEDKDFADSYDKFLIKKGAETNKAPVNQSQGSYPQKEIAPSSGMDFYLSHGASKVTVDQSGWAEVDHIPAPKTKGLSDYIGSVLGGGNKPGQSKAFFSHSAPQESMRDGPEIMSSPAEQEIDEYSSRYTKIVEPIDVVGLPNVHESPKEVRGKDGSNKIIPKRKQSPPEMHASERLPQGSGLSYPPIDRESEDIPSPAERLSEWRNHQGPDFSESNNKKGSYMLRRPRININPAHPQRMESEPLPNSTDPAIDHYNNEYNDPAFKAVYGPNRHPDFPTGTLEKENSYNRHSVDQIQRWPRPRRSPAEQKNPEPGVAVEPLNKEYYSNFSRYKQRRID